MILTERIGLMVQLGKYLKSPNKDLEINIEKAYLQNPWFTPEFIRLTLNHIAEAYLDKSMLEAWIAPYTQNFEIEKTPVVGLVMAGNIPLVGFHDFLSVFISGCKLKIKLSSKDKALWGHILEFLKNSNNKIDELVSFEEQLKNCDAYIATGSNNSSRYFKSYFEKYPHIIRHNRSSMAILSGKENEEELNHLADDMCLYYGLGCRNVTQLLVPKNYDFSPLSKALERYNHHMTEPKYKNNYDYQLAIILLNRLDYLSAGPLLLLCSDSLFAPLSIVHFKEYEHTSEIESSLPPKDEIQCIISSKNQQQLNFETVDFGLAQFPSLNDYADEADTLAFLNSIKKS